MPLTFTNVNGDELGPVGSLIKRQAEKEFAITGQKPKKAKRATTDKAYHKGWRVVGIPPGAWEDAVIEHERFTHYCTVRGDKIPKALEKSSWEQKFRLKAVRHKPYEIEESAQLCATMARQAGWVRVILKEVKMGAAPGSDFG
jgi:hypothetical protein